jgi:transcriptional regulator with XRE-family HTH domain
MDRTGNYCYAIDDRYTAHFASTLRDLMEEKGTTQKELAAFVGIRPQSLAQYTSGETQPNGDKLLKIAEYFGVTVDYLLTGTVIENIPVYEMLGFSPNTVENIKLVKEGYFEDAPGMLAMLDCLLADKDFYKSMEQAAYWHNEKNGTTDEYQKYCEWQAAQYMQTFLLNFFKRDFTSIYAGLTKQHEAMQESASNRAENAQDES